MTSLNGLSPKTLRAINCLYYINISYEYRINCSKEKKCMNILNVTHNAFDKIKCSVLINVFNGDYFLIY